MQDKKLLTLAAAISDSASHDPRDAPISISAGLADWMLAQSISLGFIPQLSESLTPPFRPEQDSKPRFY